MFVALNLICSLNDMTLKGPEVSQINVTGTNDGRILNNQVVKFCTLYLIVMIQILNLTLF